MQQYITMGSVLSELFSTYGIDILKGSGRINANIITGINRSNVDTIFLAIILT